MTATELVSTLEGVRNRGTGKWTARCPSHEDRSPSLSIVEGERGVLLRCWAGCELTEITAALGLSIRDLFYGDLVDGDQRRAALQRRAQERAFRNAENDTKGRRMDALRAAEELIRSAQGISIAQWSDETLDAALLRLADAYCLLEGEERS